MTAQEDLSLALHRRFCGDVCPPDGFSHRSDREWLSDATAILADMSGWVTARASALSIRDYDAGFTGGAEQTSEQLRTRIDEEDERLWAIARTNDQHGAGSTGLLVDMTDVAVGLQRLRDGCGLQARRREDMDAPSASAVGEPSSSPVRVLEERRQEGDCRADEVTAKLLVDRWSSRCGACGHPCDPREPTHETILGSGADAGMSGCGARFISIGPEGWFGDDIGARLAALRPDLPLRELLDLDGRPFCPSGYAERYHGVCCACLPGKDEAADGR